MKFCPKCGGLMIKKNNYWECTKCGYKEKIKSSSSEASFVEEKTKGSEIVVVEKDLQVLPIDESIVCPKCGNRGAYFWSIQTRAADEGETKFYKCTKCGYTWRSYD